MRKDEPNQPVPMIVRGARPFTRSKFMRTAANFLFTSPKKSKHHSSTMFRGEAFTINGQLDSLVGWNLYLFDIDFKPELFACRAANAEAKRSTRLQYNSALHSPAFVRAISLFVRGTIQCSLIFLFFFFFFCLHLMQ